MGIEWDRRIAHDYRYWMSDGVESDERMWATGVRDLDELIRDLPRAELSKWHALEIGCGVGRLSRAASKRFRNVTGIDVSAEGISRARKLNADIVNADFRQGAGRTLEGVSNDSIDCIYSFAAIGSMPNEVFASYLHEFSRVLRKSGYCCIQFYLGESQNAVREDTIALRSYKRERFIAAAQLCGLTVYSIRDLVLDFEVSDPSIGLNAVLVTMRKEADSRIAIDQVQNVLCETPEIHASESWPGSRTEYLMAVARATQLVESGDLSGAKTALEFAKTYYRDPEPDIINTLRGIEQRIGSSTNSSVNTEAHSLILRSNPKYPQIENVLANAADKLRQRTDLELRTTTGGEVVICCRGIPLENPDKPRSAAQGWARRAINESEAQRASELVVAGFGAGYHIEELMKLTSKPIHVVELDPCVMALAGKSRNIADILERAATISFSIEDFKLHLAEGNIAADAYLLVHPQSKAIRGREIDELRRTLLSRHGCSSLRPSIGVVGPLYGGSLPIAGYVARALASLGQRVNYINLSSFFKPYTEIDGFIRTPGRRNGLQGQFVDFISQLVLEALTEKPVDILICLAQAPLSGTVLDELRRRGVVTAMWFVEDCRRFSTWKDISRYYDYMFLIQTGEFPSLVEAAGAGRAIYLPVGCDPDIHTPLTLTEEERKRWGSSLSFVGAGYNNRQQMFATLARRDFKIWGTEWALCAPFDKLVQEKGRRLDPTEYVKIFNASDINLNLHSSGERDGVEPDGDFVNPRTFELAACGVFQLVDERTLLPSLFKLGSEVATFRDKASLEASIDYYETHPEERQKIAAAGRARVLAEHTYRHRMETLLSHIYADKYQLLADRARNNPWEQTLRAAGEYPELKKRLEQVFERGEDPTLESLVMDVQLGKGALTETEQKILFMHQFVKQVAYVEEQRQG